ncbi:MAG: methyltransferase domain-containing protein, partial [Desulfobacterales bacterium]|nr:methyltransferase domain-containing protein [Desulfobacterales bacterium]
GIFNKIYLMTEAESPVDLRRAGDRLLAQVHRDMRSGEIESAFLPAMIFPGQELRKQNLADWQAFWDPQRKDRTLDALASASALGFTTDAFRPFARILSASKQPEEYRPIPEPFFALMGITRGSNGTWMQFATLTPGPNYDARQFHQHYAAGVRILDPTFFSQRLGQLLFSTFMKMLIIIGISVTLLLFFFFLDLKLTFIALAPVLFALVCTLGTLNLIGHALDIPALMLAIIAMGMGIDYALFLVRARQRYGGMHQPGFGRIKLAVIMAAVSTLIGFGVLCVAEHALLRSAGITSFLGIGYALIGAFFLLPPLLDHWFRKEKEKGGLSGHWRRRVMNRYRTLETYPRLFARFKMKNDVMFSELPRLLNGCGNMRTVLDIGTGYGVPGCCILEHCARAKIYGIDPDRERIRVAALAFGHRGTVTCAAAPDIPPAPEAADAAFLLDIIHFLDDSALNLTLARLRKALHSNAALIIRAVIPPPDGNYSRLWKLDALRMKLTGVQAHHRTTDAIRAMVEGAGFQIRQIEQSGNNIESTWFIATPKPEDGTGISA